MSEQRTEQATPQRKKKARESGDAPRSRELQAGAATLAGLALLGANAERFALGWRESMMRLLHEGIQTGSAWTTAALLSLLRALLLPVAVPALVCAGGAFAAAAIAGIAQSGGFALYPKLIQPQMSRLSPASHAKTLFSARSLMRIAKSLVPALVVAALGWQMLRRSLLETPVLGLARLPGTLSAAYSLGLKAALVMVAWAALDYAVERRAWNQRLRMTKQDIRQEVREQAGNPQMKGKIRQMQRAMRRRKVKADIGRAAVVITNPTHYAVALEFSFDTMQAPTVLAKGRDLHALDIREEARWAGVPMIENPPLARSLYRAVEVGQSIPYELYSAVAGILAFLLHDMQRQAARDAERQTAAPAQRYAPPGMLGFEGGI